MTSWCKVLADIQELKLPVVEEIGDTTVNVGLISGGHAPNVIADKAEAHLLIRLVGPTEEVMEAIKRCVAGRVRVEFSLDLKFVRMRKVGSLPTMIAKFATDIPTLTNWGEPFLLGPGSIHVAHNAGWSGSRRRSCWSAWSFMWSWRRGWRGDPPPPPR